MRIEDLVPALHALGDPPSGEPWNIDELSGLLGSRPAKEAAVLVGFVERATGLHVVLTRRNDQLRQHAGQVSFPGGRRDPEDADLVTTALRETHEEIGVSACDVTPLGYLDALATVTGFRVVPVVAGIDSGYEAIPDPSEVAEVFEVPLAFLLEPGNLQARFHRVGGRDREVWEYRYPSQRIWGATASILLNLRQRLEAVR